VGDQWVRRLLVVTGARCPLTKPVVAAVELQAATGPHCSRGVQQPGGNLRVWRCTASRLPEVRGRACAGAASASYASCRSDSIPCSMILYVCQLPLGFYIAISASYASCRSDSIYIIYIAARRYLRVRGTARADSRRSGVGLAPRPQALPMPAAALILYIYIRFRLGFFGILALLAKALSHLLGYLAIGFFAKVRFTSRVSPYRKGRPKKGFLRRRRFAIFGKRR
jgi:hypothetical protein